MNSLRFIELKSRLLTAFPEVPKGQYIGTERAHDCDKNSFRASKKYGYDIYVGFILFHDSYYGWTTTAHVFNVYNGMVVEMTNLDCSDLSNSFYFGEKVPKGTPLKNLWDYSKSIPK